MIKRGKIVVIGKINIIHYINHTNNYGRKKEI
jgi:hypothetical protein